MRNMQICVLSSVKRAGSSAEADRLCNERFPNHRAPSRNLNTAVLYFLFFFLFFNYQEIDLLSLYSSTLFQELVFPSLFVMTSVTFVFICLFPHQTNKSGFLHLSLCVIPVFLKRQRPLLPNRDVTLVHDSRTKL
jgi:hypothetical protein